jgi:hypothetical protein
MDSDHSDGLRRIIMESCSSVHTRNIQMCSRYRNNANNISFEDVLKQSANDSREW